MIWAVIRSDHVLPEGGQRPQDREQRIWKAIRWDHAQTEGRQRPQTDEESFGQWATDSRDHVRTRNQSFGQLIHKIAYKLRREAKATKS